MIKLSDLKLNPDNPRFIRDEKFRKLVASVKDFPKMMAIRPIIVDKDNMILGGNMRYRACKELGMKEVPDEWVRKEADLTEEERRRFVIEDNMPFGEWNFDKLANEWGADKLLAWGFDAEELTGDFEEENREIQEMELLAYEHYDYIVLLFKNTNDWLNALEKYGIKNVNISAISKKKIGLGRVVDGSRFL